MTIKVGDKVPNAKVFIMKDGRPTPTNTDDLFKGKKVVLFSVPGAFTPTCSQAHLPGFVVNADKIKAGDKMPAGVLTIPGPEGPQKISTEQLFAGKKVVLFSVPGAFTPTCEDYGYSPDICGYVKADLAMQLRGGEHPMGRIPKPSLAVYTNACNTHIKWAEIWERLYRSPIFTLDVPGTREAGGQTWAGHRDFENDRSYVSAQIKELIGLCEEVSGKKFDIDRLRETMGHANTMSRAWKRVLELNKSMPSVFNAVTDGTVYLGMANGFRGTRADSEYFERVVEELEYKAAHGLGTVREEKYRLIFVGVPCYPIFRRFNEMLTEHGGAFISSTRPRPAGPTLRSPRDSASGGPGIRRHSGSRWAGPPERPPVAPG